MISIFEQATGLKLEERVMLDTIYSNIRDLNSSQLIRYFSENPEDAEKIRHYINETIDSDYSRQRIEFLTHICQTYLD